MNRTLPSASLEGHIPVWSLTSLVVVMLLLLFNCLIKLLTYSYPVHSKFCSIHAYFLALASS